MGCEIMLDGSLESFEVIEDFREVISKLNEAAGKGWLFTILSLDEGVNLAFSIPNITYVKDQA